MATSSEVTKLVSKMPSPHEKDPGVKDDRPGILSDADKEAMDKALADLRAGGREAFAALVGMLVENDPPADSKARHAIHALAIQAGTWPAEERRGYAAALAGPLGGDKPKEVQGFLARQVQLCGDKSIASALGKLLADEQLSAPAAAALLAIGDGAAEPFRAALSKATGRPRLNVIQALGVLKDAESAEGLREAVGDADGDTRQVARWALANIGDGGAVDLLIKGAEAEGFERVAAVKACLLLAENLQAKGKAAEARKIYAHLRDSRKDKSDAYVREAAERGLAAVG